LVACKEVSPLISQDYLEVLQDHDDWAALIYDWDAPYRPLSTDVVICDVRPPGY
jgi:hypothetical protein